VEHVVSGQATHFASPEELLAFMALVLTELEARAPEALAPAPVRRGGPAAWGQGDVGGAHRPHP
jgi:hypothetical protein